MTSDQNTGADGSSGSSKLCLACGLCCLGAFFTRVTVEPNYLAIAAELGVAVETLAPDKIGFSQPCVLYQNQRCSIYPNHPPGCQTFRCVLLGNYERGEMAVDNCLKIVHQVKMLLTDGGKNPQEEFSLRSRRKQLEKISELAGSDDTSQANAALALRAAALDVLIQRYFRPPEQDAADQA